MREWFPVPLRLALGIIFVAHGAQHAFGLFDGGGIDALARVVSHIGFAPERAFAYLIAYTELIGGICLLLGIATRIAAACLAALTLIILFTIYAKNGFFLSSGGYEYHMLLVAGCSALICSGPGPWSIFRRL